MNPALLPYTSDLTKITSLTLGKITKQTNKNVLNTLNISSVIKYWITAFSYIILTKSNFRKWGLANPKREDFTPIPSCLFAINHACFLCSCSSKHVTIRYIHQSLGVGKHLINTESFQFHIVYYSIKNKKTKKKKTFWLVVEALLGIPNC